MRSGRIPMPDWAYRPYARPMPPASIRLSKSGVTAGLQCHKRLWWTVHEPTAPELQPDEAFQALFDTQVGEVARTHVPGGLLIDLPYNAYDELVVATAGVLQRGMSIIYISFFRIGSQRQPGILS